MEPVPSLREVFAALAGGSADPASALENAGHSGLPDHLVAEAIVNYADAAPVEVAEHLSPFVIAHSPVPQGDEAPPSAPDTTDGLELLAAAPTGPEPAPDHDAGHEHHGLELDAAFTPDGGEPAPDQLPVLDQDGPDGSDDLSFGAGEPGTDRPAQVAEAGQPAGDLGVDPADLDSASSQGSWLDTATADAHGEPGPGWEHERSDTEQLDVQHEDDQGVDPLDGADL